MGLSPSLRAEIHPHNARSERYPDSEVVYMGIRDWINILLSLFAIAGVVVSIAEYRARKRTLASTVGWLIFLLSFAFHKGLPVIDPSLDGAADVFSDISMIGLLVVFVAWWVSRRNKQHAS